MSAAAEPAFDEAERLSVSRSGPLESDPSVVKAAELLQRDQVVAFPTETVYGLGANALSSTAVSKIYAAKGRPSDNPLIVHVSDREMLNSLLPNKGQTVPDMLDCLMREFWPGPLTIIFDVTRPTSTGPAAAVNAGGKDTNEDNQAWREPLNKVATEVSAGLESLAIRMPAHDLARTLIKRAGVPLAAPSANLSSRPSPTSATHVWNDLGKGRGVAAILDGGECLVGLESTVVDYVEPEFALTEQDRTRGGQLRVLRAGGISPEQLQEALEKNGFATVAGSSGIQVYNKHFKSKAIESKPTTPGMKYKHYSPTNARVVLVKPNLAGNNEDDATLPTIQDLISFSAFSSTTTSPFRIGLMLTDETWARIEPLSSQPLSSTSNSNDSDQISVVKLSPSKTKPQDIPIPTPLVEPVVLRYSYGSASDNGSVLARRLFGGLRCLDELDFDSVLDDATRSLTDLSIGSVEEESLSRNDSPPTTTRIRKEGEKRKGVDVILLECVPETGVGLAVMERSRKAAGVAGDGQGMSFRL
ncbi:hypothetical protein OIV83_005766 [Microbotryomycetes sp. JL201]|nr:hypothetical protein OIV83_005766 [Microbotryomycetes sp. JL201]